MRSEYGYAVARTGRRVVYGVAIVPPETDLETACALLYAECLAWGVNVAPPRPEGECLYTWRDCVKYSLARNAPAGFALFQDSHGGLTLRRRDR